MTINLGATDERYGSWAARAERIASLVDGHAVDVIIAQAAIGAADDASPPLALLTDRLPALPHVTFAAADRHPHGWFGPAIVSRYPIRSQRIVPLSLQPGLEDSNRRCLLVAGLDVDGRPLTAISAHFSWVEAQASDNIRETVDATAQLAGSAVLAGDFNQPPASTALQPLAAAGWSDAWGEQPGGETFEAGRPSTRIDYIWARGPIVGAIRDVRVVGGGGEAALSDHHAVVATVGW